MGIRLETAFPNRRFLLYLTAWRFVLSALFLTATAIQFGRPWIYEPLRWLLLASLLLGLCLGFFFAGLRPLCFLQRPIDFCENGFQCQTFDFPLELLQTVRWKQERFRLLGIFPIGPVRESMICVSRYKGKTHKLYICGFYYENLRETFDEAYQFSLPWELIVYRNRKKRRKHSANAQKPNFPPQQPLGPPVPPSSHWQPETPSEPSAPPQTPSPPDTQP